MMAARDRNLAPPPNKKKALSLFFVLTLPAPSHCTLSNLDYTCRYKEAYIRESEAFCKALVNDEPSPCSGEVTSDMPCWAARALLPS